MLPATAWPHREKQLFRHLGELNRCERIPIDAHSFEAFLGIRSYEEVEDYTRYERAEILELGMLCSVWFMERWVANG